MEAGENQAPARNDKIHSTGTVPTTPPPEDGDASTYDGFIIVGWMLE